MNAPTSTTTRRVVLHGDDPVVGRHQVHGSGLLPGLAYIDLLFRAALPWAGVPIDQLALRSVSIYRPLVVPRGASLPLSIVFTARNGGWLVEVHDAGGAAGPYATARLRTGAAALPASRIDVAALAAGRTEHVSLDRVYRQARRCGLVHSGVMKGEGGVHLGPAGHLIDVRVPTDTTDPGDHLLHPTLIDGAVMAAGVVLQGLDNPENDALYLPFFYESFRAAGPMARACFAQVVPSSYRETSGIRSFDLHFFDEAGRCIACLDGITTKRADRAQDALTAAEAAAAATTTTTTPASGRHSTENDMERQADASAIDCETILRRIFAEYLGMAPASLDLDAGFYELGLESSQLLALLQDLEDEFGRPLNPTLLFECETLRQLMAYLAETTAAAPAAAPQEPREPEEAEEPIVEYVPIVQPASAWHGSAAVAAAAVAPPVDDLASSDDGIEDILRTIVAEYLRVPPDEVDARTGFAELGLESSQLLDLLADVESACAVQLNPTVLFEYDNLSQLARHVAECRREAGVPPLAAAPVPAAPAAAAMAARDTCRFAADEPFLADHVVLGQPALMGVTHPCLAIEAFHAARGGFVPVELTNVRFLGGPIRLAAGEAVTLRVSFDEGFTVTSRTTSQPHEQDCCRAERIEPIAAAPQAIDLARLRSAGRRLSADEIRRLYARTERFSIGPMLQTVDVAHAHGGDVLVCRIDLRGRRAKGGIAAWAFDPLLLHSCYFYNGDAKQARTYVPFVIGRLRLLRPMPEVAYVINSFRVRKDDFFSFDVAIVDEAGRYVAELENVAVKSISQEAIAQGARPSAMARDAVRASATASHSAPQAAPAPREPAGPLDIAIVGMSGAYPRSPDLAAFWRNLADGIDCITEIPAERWDWRDYDVDDRTGDGRVTCRWGGFLDGIEDFDPLFFNISPREAERVDPQERLFLEHCWNAMEDAGYTRERLHAPDGINRRVGVYAGVMSQEYALFAVESTLRGAKLGLGGGVSSIATRVSYVLDLHGPSLAVDSMCSSSLTALALACQALAQRQIDAAFCGGVNLSPHPNKYLMLAKGKFVSSKGRCESFGEGGDGYIPAEGVGVLMLRRLRDAEADRDRILGVVKGAAVGHGGKASGYTVPSPKAQHRVIAQAIREAGVDPRCINYIEAHGTGTSLGDPVEIAGLAKFYRGDETVAGPIHIGSVKSNIGHAESAAGVAGVTKVLLQFAHRQLVPSLHSRVLNRHIDFAATPFEVNQRLRDWPAVRVEESKEGGRVVESPRLATVSSFGAGGTNAHVVLQEYVAPAAPGTARRPDRSACIVLSARHPASLRAQAARLADALGRGGRLDDVAYTLQVGREAMPHRLAFTAFDIDEAADLLRALAEGRATDRPVHTGVVKDDKSGAAIVRDAAPEVLAEAWARGQAVDWEQLYASLPPAERPRRIELPTYAFRRQRLWIADGLKQLSLADAPARTGAAPAAVRPLVLENRSGVHGLRFAVRLLASDFFLRDHVIRGEQVLPGVVQLELLRAAMRQAWGTQDGVMRLAQVVWLSPVRCAGTSIELEVELRALDAQRLAFAIRATGAADGRPCCQGEASLEAPRAPADVDLRGLKARGGAVEDAADFYAALQRAGFAYGPGLRGLRALHRIADDRLLAAMAIPAAVDDARADLHLHPAVLDAALQSTALLADADQGMHLPYALGAVTIHRPCLKHMWADVRRRPPAGELRTFDISLCDADGKVAIEIEAFSARPIAEPVASEAGPGGVLLCHPEWRALPAIGTLQPSDASARHAVIVLDADPRLADALHVTLPRSEVHLLPGSADRSEAERFQDGAWQLLACARAVLASATGGAIRLDVVIAGDELSPLLGLHGQLQSLTREFSHVSAQLHRIDRDAPAEATAARLGGALAQAAGPSLRSWRGDVALRLTWQDTVAPAATAAEVWRHGGVYVVTGGGGALGFLFAEEAATQARGITVLLVGRRALDDAIRSKLDVLATLGATAEYHALDIADRPEVERFARRARAAHGRIHGILHASGVTHDALARHKTEAAFRSVLDPKVRGLAVLDEVFAGEPLDFFIAFSSAAAVLGNAGQTDYAAANAYMDRYMHRRARQVAEGRRHGRSLSIGWPLWQHGGMGLSEAEQAALARRTGLQPLATDDGLAAFYRCVASGQPQVMVLAGEAPRLRRLVDHLNGTMATAAVTRPAAPAPAAAAIVAAAAGDAGASAAGLAQALLSRLISDMLDVDIADIDDESEFKDFGFDSIAFTELANAIHKATGVTLLPTIFYEHTRLRALAQHLADSGAAVEPLEAPEMLAVVAHITTHVEIADAPSGDVASSPQTAAASGHGDRVAIIGMSGCFPQAADLDEFWERLAGEHDCIREVPADRWRWQDYAGDPTREANKTNSRWGGFIDGLRRFDPLFFDISPREAALMDPQQRLLMTHVWLAIEDAGYSARDLAGSDTGLFIGTASSGYGSLVAQSGAGIEGYTATGSVPSIGPNRMSYLLDLHGPSEPIETACSSSLVAIHRALLAMRHGDCEMAIAGGVNTLVIPGPHISFSKAGMLAADGRCKTFSRHADGYVRGEGAGMLFLKKLDAALRDGDPVHAVILGSAENHGGRANSLTAPNQSAQVALLVQAYGRAAVNPRTIGYIEAHGTGTRLGDPIEINALKQAFSTLYQSSDEIDGAPGCLLGSVKTNIGHLELAAGVAGVIKVLLQMRHGTIVKSLHSDEPNPYIDLAGSPFRLAQRTQPWDRLRTADGRELPRRAGVSSFGFGGVNAHVVLEEFIAPARVESPAGSDAPCAVLLSARTGDGLRRQAMRQRGFLSTPAASTLDLHDIAYTLRCGRVAMEHRLAVVVESIGELRAELDAWLRGDPACRVITGSVRTARERNGQAAPEAPATGADLSALCRAWVAGGRVDWPELASARARRVHLPGYAFADEEHWITPATSAPAAQSAVLPAQYHPMIHEIVDGPAPAFTARFTGDESFLRDHRLLGRPVLPAAAFLEMVCAASSLPIDQTQRPVQLRHVAWVAPYEAGGGALRLAIGAAEEGGRRFEILGGQGDASVAHVRGSVECIEPVAAPQVDLPALQRRCTQAAWSADECYQRFAHIGLVYGPTHRRIESLQLGAVADGGREVLARLVLPAGLTPNDAAYYVHPAMLDAAFQATIGAADPQARPQAAIPYALDEMTVFARLAPGDWWVHVRPVAGGRLARRDIDLIDAQGRVACRIRGFCTLAVERSEHTEDVAGELLFFEPVDVAADAVPAVEAALRDEVLVLDLGSRRALPSKGAQFVARDGRTLPAYFLHAAGVVRDALRRIAADAGRRLQVLLPAGGDEAPVLAALEGVLLAARLEWPGLRARLVLVPATDEGAALDGVLDAPGAWYGAAVLDLRATQPAVRSWIERTPSDGEAVPSPWKVGGVYVIAGGAGGLGAAIAADIAAGAERVTIVLCGRAPLDDGKRALLQTLRCDGAAVIDYTACDIDDADAAKRLVRAVVDRHGPLRGVIHCAGMLRDGRLATQAAEDFEAACSAKVAGLVHLDEATRDQPLDLFIACSSLVAVRGNAAQAGYAAANAFMDRFVALRNARAARGERRGHAVSINWPLLAFGGMHMPAEHAGRVARETGLAPLPATALRRALREVLASGRQQVLVLHGAAAPLRRWMAGPVARNGRAPAQAAGVRPVTATVAVHDTALLPATQDYLKRVLAQVTRMAPERIDVSAELERYGIDSLLVTEMTLALEKDLGPLPKTLLFEYRTLAELAEHLVAAHAERLGRMLIPESSVHQPTAPREEARSGPAEVAAVPMAASPTAASTDERGAARRAGCDDIAIIGIAGRYPQADDLVQLWDNLAAGVDGVTEIPADRWDYAAYYDSEGKRPGTIRTKWGGFISGVDEFDALFFNISGREAEVMDPQERLFLQCAYQAIEDAGYTRGELAARTDGCLTNVGVFVGVMYMEYQLFAAQEQARGHGVTVSGNPASVANRVSYYFNFNGPSVALDTMCSSSLTSLHLAKQSLRSGECAVAVAGGVNVSVHPNKYLMLAMGNFGSSQGRCTSFGAGGDGYVPGEGVGAVLLKPLDRAVRDGDRIHGVLKGSAVNHGGKTNGYTVPNPRAQADVVVAAMKDAGVEPGAIDYVEAHGTGTSLGDPIEIGALGRVFAAVQRPPGSIPIGSIKSSIGHCESAAGIAGITKVLLQMKHGRLAPSLHAEVLNPNIDWDRSPFRVQRVAADWPRRMQLVDGGLREQPRLASVSSFGAGGSNAHVVIEEWPAVPSAHAVHSPGGEMLVLSARSKQTLRRKVEDLLQAIDREGWRDEDLADLCHTLRVGREPMDERFAAVVSSIDRLRERLAAYLADGDKAADCEIGNARQHKEVMALFASDPDLDRTVARWIAAGRLRHMLALWVKGLPIDWRTQPAPPQARRLSLPAYPFARERHWLSVTAAAARLAAPARPAGRPLFAEPAAGAGPVIARFSGEEFFLDQHRLADRRLLPGSVYMELVRAAVASQPGAAEGGQVVIRNLSWTKPFFVDPPAGAALAAQLEPAGDGTVRFRIIAEGGAADGELHCQGTAAMMPAVTAADADLAALQRAHGRRRVAGSDCYAAYASAGMHYGPAMQAVQNVHVGDGAVLAQLVLPAALRGELADYVVHPAMLDAAIHSAACLAEGNAEPRPRLAYAVGEVRVLRPCTVEMWARLVLRPAEDAATAARLQRIDIDLFDASGGLCVQITGFTSREVPGATGASPAAATHLLAPRLEPVVVRPIDAAPEASSGYLHVVFEAEAAQRLRHRQPDARVLALDGRLSQDEAVRAIDAAPVRQLVWLVGFHDPADRNALSLRAVQDNRIAAMFTIFKALQARGYLKADLAWTVVTRQAVPAGTALPIDSTAAGLHGLVGTMAKEIGRWRFRLLDLERDDDVSLDELLSLPFDAQGGCLVRRSRSWHRLELARCRTQAPEAVVYRQRGVYVVIGGSGGIGSVFTDSLIRRHDAQVVWIGRRALDDALRARIDALGQLGTAPRYVAADARDPEALARACADIRQALGRIDGVVVSTIGDLDVGLETMDERVFFAALSAKTDVVANAYQVFGDASLDFFLCFSSLVSFTRDHGKASYSAGSVFLDAFAAQMRRRDSVPVKVVNWGYWGDVGVAAAVPEAFRKRMAKIGMAAITPEAGMQAIETLLAGPFDQLVCLATTRPDVLLELAGPMELTVLPGVRPAALRAWADRIHVPSLGDFDLAAESSKFTEEGA
jgi:polyketide synthase PksN